MSPDVSILIPLHRSETFAGVVAANVERLAPAFRVVVSDPDDDAVLGRIRDRVSRPGRVEWLGPRPLAPGWVAHYNDLLARVDTEFFMWLPHDDEIDADYVRRCRAAIGPGVVGATGVIEAVEGPGLRPVVIPTRGDSIPDDPASAYVSEANLLLFDWNLGIAMRSVFVTDRVRPILDTDELSTWADVVWCYGCALDGPLVEVPDARYRKRFYDQSTHASWGPSPHPMALPHLRREVRRRPELDRRDDILDELVRRSTAIGARRLVELQDRLDELQAAHHDVRADLERHVRHVVDLEAALDLARAEAARESARAGNLSDRIRTIEASRTWRLRRALAALRPGRR